MYEQKACVTTKEHSERSMPPIVPSLLWVFLWLAMWCWAIAGPLCVVLGILSYFVDLGDVLAMPGRDALSVGGVLGGVGLSFVWLRMRGYLKFCGE
jgi:hypothetical protein